jgi:hypothetical protein
MEMNRKQKLMIVLCVVTALLVTAGMAPISAMSETIMAYLRPGFRFEFNGTAVPLPAGQTVLVHEGRSYVPARFIAEQMGGAVLWDETNQLIRITSGGVPESAAKLKPSMVPSDVDIEEWGGANLYDNAGDNPGSRYYVNPDFYRMRSDNQLTLIEQFRTYQQTSEWSCGPASALMVLWHFGVREYDEWDISVMMGAHTDWDDPEAIPGSADEFGEYGTNVGQMVEFFESLAGYEVVQTSYRPNYTASDLIPEGDPGYTEADWGNLPPSFSYMSLYTTDNDYESENWADAADSYFVKWLTGHLEGGRPVMVEWADWDGHWQVIIGYDNNGTPEIGDDMLIFADPYDTSDHWQDGYYYYPLERWFYMWHDRNIAPKPYQLQPFLVVNRVD